MLLTQTWKHTQREKYALAIDLKKIEKPPPCILSRPLKHTHPPQERRAHRVSIRLPNVSIFTVSSSANL